MKGAHMQKKYGNSGIYCLIIALGAVLYVHGGDSVTVRDREGIVDDRVEVIRNFPLSSDASLNYGNWVNKRNLMANALRFISQIQGAIGRFDDVIGSIREIDTRLQKRYQDFFVTFTLDNNQLTQKLSYYDEKHNELADAITALMKQRGMQDQNMLAQYQKELAEVQDIYTRLSTIAVTLESLKDITSHSSSAITQAENVAQGAMQESTLADSYSAEVAEIYDDYRAEILVSQISAIEQYIAQLLYYLESDLLSYVNQLENDLEQELNSIDSEYQSLVEQGILSQPAAEVESTQEVSSKEAEDTQQEVDQEPVSSNEQAEYPKKTTWYEKVKGSISSFISNFGF